MAKSKKPQYVVVRTYSAGVHCGELVSRNGREVTLRNTRRLWRWAGANTLSEVAVAGVGAGSKVSVAAPENLLTEAIEVIACTAEGEASLRSAKWEA